MPVRAGLVEVKLADQLAGALDAVELHAGFPYRCRVLPNRNFKQCLHNLEQARQHFGGGEILFDFKFAERIARFLELLADVSVVPGLRIGIAQLL